MRYDPPGLKETLVYEHYKDSRIVGFDQVYAWITVVKLIPAAGVDRKTIRVVGWGDTFEQSARMALSKLPQDRLREHRLTLEQAKKKEWLN